MTEGFKLQKVVDNKKSWLENDDKIRASFDGDYDAYYYIDNEKLALNVKNIDLFLNPSQGMAYDVWVQSRKYDYPIPESGLTVGYPVPGGVDWTYIDPKPKEKTFFEFYQTFWENMINVRNRQYITDGKTGGYPTLQSIWWKYIEQESTINVPNNKYTYQKLIDYVEGIGPYWMKLVEQMVPATTIWNTGVKLENSIFQKQKFVYRRQRGCQFIQVPVEPCYVISNIFNFSCAAEYVNFNIYPWNNGDVDVSNFESILANRISKFLSENSLSLNDCVQNSTKTDWYIDLRIGGYIIIQELFYVGYGFNDVPTNKLWRDSLIEYLPNLYDYGYTYFLNGNELTITSLTCITEDLQKITSLNVGINISINCN